MIIKNITDGPKVVNSTTGPVTIGPGSEVEVELSEAEHTTAMLMGWFEEVDAGPKPKRTGKAAAAE
ncbi:hypothetical protein [Blastomonas sp. CCH1-A6]|uniref:hypothetical protein n=1 Tax=Blastomonas sp. CCH1-A6 TaxID=1768762 RepID=UPI00082DF3E3|tara:strand:+ start:18099 stop:18296 length:198 start_codon:yes stop_codon:yes gene_type:complete